jgi:hypothetical protein
MPAPLSMLGERRHFRACIIRVMPMSDEDVLTECRHALADAGLAAERVRFFRLRELGTGNIGAAWFRPHADIEPDDRHFPGDDAEREEANSGESRKLHRIAVPAEPDDRVLFAALVRHELEHARQWDAQPVVFDLQDFIEGDVLTEIAGGLDGCGGGLINTVPSEMDCNAAASIYIAGRFSSAEIQPIRNGPNRFLACSLIGPLPPETLPIRMVAFAYIHRAAVERHAERRGSSVTSILSSLDRKARDYWVRLAEGM